VPAPPLGPRLAIAAAATALAVGVGLLLWGKLRAGPTSVEVFAEPDGAAETTWNGQEAYVVDAVAGMRSRRASTFRHPMVAVDASDHQEIVKRRCKNGFQRLDELPATLRHPTVLAVGDSHLDGIVSTAENATTLLERASQEGNTPYYCLNAGCGYYSLWQHVLRARDLLPRWRPRVVVIVVFLGNDFLDLDDPSVPHLDAALVERPPRTRTKPETTSAREREMAIVEPYQAAFWQGLNQAMLLHREPARLEVWMQQAAYAVAAMQRAAKEHDAQVLWALLPSFDLAFPDHTMGMSPLAAEVVRDGAQRRLRDAFVDVLRAADANVVDVEPAFRRDGAITIYALDFHVYRRGHRLLFETLRAPIDALLAK
jgi:hypothetical protein